ncbi:MAG: hypothetical protein IJB65_00055 [Clostridia bacterium]|nr:hypothetical protein [Clostridia bacterium]
MCTRNLLLSGCACAFGTGILLACLLPYGALVCVQGVVILGLGAVAVMR